MSLGRAGDTASLRKRIVDGRNLWLAWRRVLRFLDTTSHFVDHIEVARFAADIDGQLESIADELRRGVYRMAPLRSAPQPKARNEATGDYPMRDIHWIGPRDQVAWLAVVNVIGPILDARMPDWSYGHRLMGGWGVRPRNADERHSRHFIWSPNHSWPMLQRHVQLSARAIADGTIDPSRLSADERMAWAYECERPRLRRIWALRDIRAACPGDDAFHASAPVHAIAVDLKGFTDAISTTDLVRVLRRNFAREPDAVDLVECLLEFRVDGAKQLDHLPMGLIVTGLLANVAMMPVDAEAATALETRPVAHFRFIDDHVMLSADPSELLRWADDYRKILRRHLPAMEYNASKLKPSALASACATGALSALHGSDIPPFDPDDPQSLWPLSPVQRVTSGAARQRFAAIDLRALTLAELTTELRSPRSPPASVEPSQDELDAAEVAQLHASLFEKMRAIARSTRNRGLFLRKLVQFLSRTGYPGLHAVCADLHEFEAEAPNAAVTQRSMFMQFMAQLIPSAAFDASNVANAYARRAALAFLEDLEPLSIFVAPSADAWYAERSRTALLEGLRIARAALACGIAAPRAAAAIGTIDRLINHAGATLTSPSVGRTLELLVYWGSSPPSDERVDEPAENTTPQECLR